ncbi:MAG: creatininase family protein [Actinobacteria bacterium]|jgi:creatinine amidohydrolase|nr:creatininase family protein [Actinomycetota bacterium]
MPLRSIADLPSPDVRDAVAANPVAVIPLGSIEQHGPHLPCGTDTFAAELVAKALAERIDALYVPFGPYGVTPIHAGHPGTINLRRSTFEALLTDICHELADHGIHTVLLVNWHEGNNASMNAVATELQDQRDLTFVAVQACYTAQRLYEPEGGELTHGGGIETLAVMAHDPELVRTERVGAPTRPADAHEMDAMRRSHEIYGFVTDVTALADDGWYGEPSWASADRAETFADDVAAATLERVQMILDLQTRRRASRPTTGEPRHE